MTLPLARKPGRDVPVTVFIVSHYGTDKIYMTMAKSAKVAALAYVGALPHIDPNGGVVAMPQVWVKDGSEKEGTAQTPLMYETAESVTIWLSEDAERALWVQAAIHRLRLHVKA